MIQTLFVPFGRDLDAILRPRGFSVLWSLSMDRFDCRNISSVRTNKSEWNKTWKFSFFKLGNRVRSSRESRNEQIEHERTWAYIKNLKRPIRIRYFLSFVFLKFWKWDFFIWIWLVWYFARVRLRNGKKRAKVVRWNMRQILSVKMAMKSVKCRSRWSSNRLVITWSYSAGSKSHTLSIEL